MQDGIVAIALTDEQRQRLRDEAGIEMASIEEAASTVMAMALAAEACRSRPDFALPAGIVVDLTDQQIEQLAQCGIAATSIAFSPRPRFAEPWTTEGSFRLCSRVVVSVGSSTAQPSSDGHVVRLRVDLRDNTAFGTGRHPSTRLAATLLERVLSGGQHVLDVGTGSGVLAIAAALLGAAHVMATDVDAGAVMAAGANVELNDVADRVRVIDGELPDDDKIFDVVVANIFPAILIEMAPRIAARVRPNGHVIVSGIVDAQIPAVIAAFTDAGFEVVDECSELGWTACALTRGG
jgi:ribosomal protein L11 methyltransferase